MLDFIGVDTLLAELTVALGLAILIGNGLAFYKARRGEKPQGVDDEAQFRPSRAIFLDVPCRRRAIFLTVAGLVITVWGMASILSR